MVRSGVLLLLLLHAFCKQSISEQHRSSVDHFSSFCVRESSTSGDAPWTAHAKFCAYIIALINTHSNIR